MTVLVVRLGRAAEPVQGAGYAAHRCVANRVPAPAGPAIRWWVAVLARVLMFRSSGGVPLYVIVHIHHARFLRLYRLTIHGAHRAGRRCSSDWRSCGGSTYPAGRGGLGRDAEQPFAEVAEGVSLEPGDVHLEDSDRIRTVIPIESER